MLIYKIGGFVRDSILGLNPKDCDYVVVGSTPIEMLSLGYSQVGRSFPVFLHPVTKEEYALCRVEKKVGLKHYSFKLDYNPSITLLEDLSRRDITINSIAIDVNGNIVDYFNGKFHLNIRLIKHISSSFTDDPLRILRVARFSSNLGFAIDSSTMSLITLMGQHNMLYHISLERIANEILKTNQYNLYNFFHILYKSQNLKTILPKLCRYMSSKYYRFKLCKITSVAGFNGLYCFYARYIQDARLSLIMNNKIKFRQYTLILQIYYIHDLIKQKKCIVQQINNLNCKRNYIELMNIIEAILTIYNYLKCDVKIIKLLAVIIDNIKVTQFNIDAYNQNNAIKIRLLHTSQIIKNSLIQ